MMNIRFDVLFDRDEKKQQHQQSIKTKLIEQFGIAQEKKGEVTCIVLLPVERVGNSGSDVYYLNLYLRNKKHPVRFVAKFQNGSKTFQEYKNSLNAHTFGLCRDLPFSSHVEEPSDRSNQDNGIIVYRFAKLNHTQAIEFRSAYIDMSYTDNICIKYLENLYQHQLPSPNDLLCTDKILLVESYNWYCRDRSVDPLGKLERISIDRDSDVGTLAKKIHEFHTLLQSDTKYKDIHTQSFFQHGDLHARNILVDSTKPEITPEIIDFEWSTSGHCLRDFVVLESTIKYLLIKEFVSNKDNKLDVLHVSPIAYVQLEEFLCQKGFELADGFDEVLKDNKNILKEGEKIAITRAFRTIAVIRREAKKVLCVVAESSGDENLEKVTFEQEYLIALFLISLGLIAFNEANEYWIIRGCNIIANAIKETSDNETK